MNTRSRTQHFLYKNIRSPLYRLKKRTLASFNQALIRFVDPSIFCLTSRLESLRGIYRGCRCFIMGNGPSLNFMNLDLFKNEFVWGTNRCYLVFDRITWRPGFYVAVDKRVVPDNAQEINKLVGDLPATRFFFPVSFRYRKTIKSKRNLYWFHEKVYCQGGSPPDNFSLDPPTVVSGVHSVTITALQLAVFLGFNPIYLMGCDTAYTIPSDVMVEKNDHNLLVSVRNNDFNHFCPDYFGEGKKWHMPHVERMVKQYEESFEVCSARNINIINATVGGNLEVFPRVNYLDLF